MPASANSQGARRGATSRASARPNGDRAASAPGPTAPAARQAIGGPQLATLAADQLESLTRLREASAVFADAVIRAQSELRGTVSAECQHLRGAASAELMETVENGVLSMIRQLVERASVWRKQHDARVEELSAELSDQFKTLAAGPGRGSRRASRSRKGKGAGQQRAPPRGRHTEPLGEETDAEQVQRVMGQALKEKDSELRHAALRALQEKATLQEQLSSAQSDLRRAAESSARRTSELHKEMKMQAGRIADLELRLTQNPRSPPPELLPGAEPQLLPPMRDGADPPAPTLSPAEDQRRAAGPEGDGDRGLGELSSIPASAGTPGSAVRFGTVLALDTESGHLSRSALVSPTTSGTDAGPEAGELNDSPDSSGEDRVQRTRPPPVDAPVGQAAPPMVSIAATAAGDAASQPMRGAETPPVPASQRRGARAGAGGSPMPPPPPPEVLLSAEAAELIAQTARHVAANGQDFAAVLMSQGPEFEFLREGSSPSLDHVYYVNLLNYELERRRPAAPAPPDVSTLEAEAPHAAEDSLKGW